MIHFLAVASAPAGEVPNIEQSTVIMGVTIDTDAVDVLGRVVSSLPPLSTAIAMPDQFSIHNEYMIDFASCHTAHSNEALSHPGTYC